jgi:transposase-like protein
MEFPKLDFADEEACFMTLVALVHPTDLRCPNCGRPEGLHVHGHHSHNSTPYYRCSGCHHKFSPWAGTVFEGTHHSPSEIWRIMQRLKAGWHFTEIARELDCQRARLSEFCHRIVPFVWKKFGPPPKKSPRKRYRHATTQPSNLRRHRSHSKAPPPNEQEPQASCALTPAS